MHCISLFHTISQILHYRPILLGGGFLNVYKIFSDKSIVNVRNIEIFFINFIACFKSLMTKKGGGVVGVWAEMSKYNVGKDIRNFCLWYFNIKFILNSKTLYLMLWFISIKYLNREKNCKFWLSCLCKSTYW